jgi:hypothetical protein
MLKLSSPEAQDVRALLAINSSPDSAKKFVRIRFALEKTLAGLHDGSLVAIARDRYPDLPTGEAIGQFENDVKTFCDALDAHGDQFDRLAKAERTRLAPYILAVTHRLFETCNQRELLGRKIASADSNHAEKCKKLRAAGMTDAEIEHSTKPPDIDAMQAELVLLDAESAALDKFIRSRNLDDLPEGFAARWMRPDDLIDPETAIAELDAARERIDAK